MLIDGQHPASLSSMSFINSLFDFFNSFLFSTLALERVAGRSSNVVHRLNHRPNQTETIDRTLKNSDSNECLTSNQTLQFKRITYVNISFRCFTKIDSIYNSYSK
jgi:hypothetical protein